MVNLRIPAFFNIIRHDRFQPDLENTAFPVIFLMDRLICDDSSHVQSVYRAECPVGKQGECKCLISSEPVFMDDHCEIRCALRIGAWESGLPKGTALHSSDGPPRCVNISARWRYFPV